MNLDLRLPLPLLRHQIEAALASVADAMRTGIEIKPQGNIELSGSNHHLVSVLPVRVTATSDVIGVSRSILPGLSLPSLLTFDLAVEFHTRLHVAEDWQLHAQSKVAYTWTRNPSTGLGLIPLPVKDIVKPILERELAKIGKQVDEWVPQLTELPRRIRDAWQELQQPISVEEPLVLRLSPRKEPIPIGDLRIEGQSMRIDVQLPLRGRVGLMETVADVPFVPLGQAIPLEEQGESKLALRIHLPWSVLERDLSGHEVTDQRGRHILRLSLGTLRVRGSGNSFTVETRFRIKGLPLLKKRTLSGLVHLYWQWVLSPETETVDIRYLWVTLKEMPPWAQSIWPILRPLFRRIMTRIVKQAINDQIRQTRDEIEAMVEDFLLPTGGRLQGNIRRLEILDLQSDDEGLNVNARLSGEARVVVTEI